MRTSPLKKEIISLSEKKAKEIINEIGHTDSSIPRTVIERLIKGDHQAYDTVYTAYYPSLREYTAAVIKDDDEAQDICQLVFEALWKKRDVLDPDKNVKGFLYNTAKFYISAYFRRNKYAQDYQQFASDIFNFTVAPDQKLIEKELTLLAEMIIERMPPQRRTVIKMHFEQCKTFEEISKEMQIGLESVRTHYKLGRKQLESAYVSYFLLILICNVSVLG